MVKDAEAETEFPSLASTQDCMVSQQHSSLHTGQDDAHGHCNQMLWILSKQHKNITKAAAVKPILKDTSPAERHRGITTLSVLSEAKRAALNAISRRHSLPGRRCGEAEAI